MARTQIEIAKDFLKKYGDVDQLNQRTKQRFYLSDEEMIELTAEIIKANDDLSLLAEAFERA
jgi:hypothetical protein